jgi:tRNA pseudouridine38-40 synthase
MNKAISTLLNSEISIMGAGRTDTGVHARETCLTLLISSLVHKLNSFLPKDIVIYDIIAVKKRPMLVLTL